MPIPQDSRSKLHLIISTEDHSMKVQHERNPLQAPLVTTADLRLLIDLHRKAGRALDRLLREWTDLKHGPHGGVFPNVGLDDEP